MKRLLFNCDQVFEVLTRGPFPTGEPSDESVEHHLRACHECRRLAEALRPAVAVLHEAVSAEQAMDLPEYQGSLPFRRPVVRRLSMTRLAGPPRGEMLQRPKVGSRRPSRPETNSVRWVAATLLFVGMVTWWWAVTNESQVGRGRQLSGNLAEATWSAPRDGVPGAGGLLKLASLGLPSDCLPLTHRPLSSEQAGELALAVYDGSLAGLQCCTQCHHAGTSPQARVHSAAVARTTQQQCQVCHRG